MTSSKALKALAATRVREVTASEIFGREIPKQSLQWTGERLTSKWEAQSNLNTTIVTY